MNKYWKYVLFPKFLDMIKDCTYIKLNDDDLTEIMNNLTRRAIQEFMFPKHSLSFDKDNVIDPLDNRIFGYYFVDKEVGDAEYFVLLGFMKAYWIETQILTSNNFTNTIYDKSVTGFSPSAMLKAAQDTYDRFYSQAITTMYNYSRVSGRGRAAWGEVNGR